MRESGGASTARAARRSGDRGNASRSRAAGGHDADSHADDQRPEHGADHHGRGADPTDGLIGSVRVILIVDLWHPQFAAVAADALARATRTPRE